MHTTNYPFIILRVLAIDIQTEKKAEAGYSEFWAPIREGDGLFAGKPVLIQNEGWITKGVKGVSISLNILNHNCSVRLNFIGENKVERRDEVMQLFPKSDYNYEYRVSPKEANVIFPVLEKGKRDPEHWPEIREKLVSYGYRHLQQD